MCFLGDRLGKSLQEIGEMEKELPIWEAWHQGYDPEQREDFRAGVIASLLWKLIGHDVTPEMIFPPPDPQALRGATRPEDGRDRVVGGEEEFKRAAMAWCVNTGGHIVHPGSSQMTLGSGQGSVASGQGGAV